MTLAVVVDLIPVSLFTEILPFSLWPFKAGVTIVTSSLGVAQFSMLIG
jgi:hypothetical protein